MSTTPEPGREAAFFTTIRSWGITRSDDRVFGGVATGVGERIGLAKAPARILTVIAALFLSGFVVLAYAAAWALLPDRQGRIIIQDFGRGVPNVGALIVIALFTMIGFGTLGDSPLGQSWTPWHINTGNFIMGGVPGVVLGILGVLVTLAIAAGIALVVVWAVREGRKSPPSQPPVWAAPPTPSNDGGDSAATPTPPAAPTAMASDGDAATGDGGTDAPAPEPASAYAAPGPAHAAAPAPAPAPAPAYAYAAPAPRVPRVPGPGPVGYLVALAWLPLSFAIAYGLDYQGRLSVYPWVAAGAIFAAGLGIIVAIVALAGRRIGFLGFVATLTLIPVTFGILQADQIRSTYEHGISWTSLTAEPTPSWVAEPVPTMGPDAVDPSNAFASDYAFIQLGASCYQQDTGIDTSAAVVRLSSVTADASIDITTTNTRVVIPRGTSLQIVRGTSSGDGTFSVQWITRGIACDVLPTASEYVTLTNPDTPLVTLRMTDDASYGTIQIEER